MKKYLFLLTTVTGIAMNCTATKSPPIIAIDTLVVNFYADSLVMSEEIKLRELDSSEFVIAIDSLHRLHSTSKEKIHSAVESYKNDLSTWKEFHEQLVKRLQYLRSLE